MIFFLSKRNVAYENEIIYENRIVDMYSDWYVSICRCTNKLLRFTINYTPYFWQFTIIDKYSNYYVNDSFDTLLLNNDNQNTHP